MAHDKTPGQSKLTTDMIKSLPPSATNLYIEIIQEFWRNEEVDLNSWHTTILNSIYKSKGDPQDPNNHRGISLKETSAKVLSIVMAQRLLKRFKQINPTSQFGHIGCQEAHHTIKKCLTPSTAAWLESYGIFIDLLTAFDTVNHDLLCQILLKYGLPATLVQNVKNLYNNCKEKIKV
jgi:hypothetical protein